MKKIFNKKNKPKIILYELNEVPRRLFNHYVAKFPNSAFAQIANEGKVFDTYTYDNGELHPWSTWPTVHRGIDNKIHNIRYLNQDLKKAKEYKPIWELLIQNKVDVGIFGSLQSYPPIKSKFCKFYLPDTFAPSPLAYPKELSDFQFFNLELTKENKALSRKISNEYILNFLRLVSNGSISKSSAFSALMHIFKEQINSKYKTRRSILQNVFSFDLYLRNIYKFKPTFSTYFTNHVAGMMHRYWKYLFFEDFQLNESEVDQFHSKSIIKAMHLANNNLKKLINFANMTGHNILIVSSMGQSFIDRGDYTPELFLKNFKNLIKALKLENNSFKLLPAMHPDYCIEAKDIDSLYSLRRVIKDLKDENNNQIFIERYKPVGLKINFIFNLSSSAPITNSVKYLDKIFDLNVFGIELIERDIGTGYHIPEGIFCWLGKDQNIIKINDLAEKVDTRQICPTILELYGIEIPNYMKPPLQGR